MHNNLGNRNAAIIAAILCLITGIFLVAFISAMLQQTVFLQYEDKVKMQESLIILQRASRQITMAVGVTAMLTAILISASIYLKHGFLLFICRMLLMGQAGFIGLATCGFAIVYGLEMAFLLTFNTKNTIIRTKYMDFINAVKGPLHCKGFFDTNTNIITTTPSDMPYCWDKIFDMDKQDLIRICLLLGFAFLVLSMSSETMRMYRRKLQEYSQFNSYQPNDGCQVNVQINAPPPQATYVPYLIASPPVMPYTPTHVQVVHHC